LFYWENSPRLELSGQRIYLLYDYRRRIFCLSKGLYSNFGLVENLKNSGVTEVLSCRDWWRCFDTHCDFQETVELLSNSLRSTDDESLSVCPSAQYFLQQNRKLKALKKVTGKPEEMGVEEDSINKKHILK
jgi:hypothetical protein